MPLPNLQNFPILKKNLPLVIAIISGLAAAVIATVYMKQQAEAERRRILEMQKNYVKVIVAAKDIPAGAMITEEMLSEETIHKKNLQEYAATSAARVLNKVALAPIAKGEQILLNKLGMPRKAERPTILSSIIPPGKRAVSVSVDNIASVGGMIRPGDYVDVVGTVAMPSGTTIEAKTEVGMTILPLFQDILVLAVGQELETYPAQSKETPSGTMIVTLALSPQEANVIAFIEEQGKVRLVLRSPKDRQTQRVEPADWESVLRALLPKEPERQVRKVEIYHGPKKEVRPLD
jgi:pilus assembly protein CpaB